MKDSALLLIDLQNDYFPGGANPLVNSTEAVMNAKLVLQNFRENQLPVFHVQHVAIRPGSTFFLPGTRGAEVHPEVAPVETESVIIKYTPNSFVDTTLLSMLRDTSVKELTICGMMTHMCVDATVRAARDYGFKCSLIADACATRDLQVFDKIVRADDVHHAFLAALNGFYATVINTKQLFN
jgi:nicotinamidase-related amidase